MAPEPKSNGYCTLTISRWELATVRTAHPEFEDSPLAITSSGRVLEASPHAERMGITAGMNLREAHSRLPSLVLVERDQELSERAFAPILKAIFEVTPFVQVERAGHVHFPLEGVLRYYKSPEALAERVLGSLPSSSVLVPRSDTTPSIGLGIAPTRFASLLAALEAARRSELSWASPAGENCARGRCPSRSGDSVGIEVSPAGDSSTCGRISVGAEIAEREPTSFSRSVSRSRLESSVPSRASPGNGCAARARALAGEPLSPPAAWIALELGTSPANFVGQFPIEVLGYVLEPEDPHDIDVWHLLGIHTLADLASLDPGLLADRFGQWAVTAWTLANGDDPEVLLPASPPLEMEVSCELDPPSFTIDQLAFASAQLATRLAEKLEAEAKRCRYLRLEILEESGRTTAVAWRVQGPLSSLAHRCRWHLESIAVSSPVIALRLIPEDLVSSRGTQLCLDGVSSSPSCSASKAWEVVEKSLYRACSILGEEAAYFVEVDTLDLTSGHLPHEEATFVSCSLLEETGETSPKGSDSKQGSSKPKRLPRRQKSGSRSASPTHGLRTGKTPRLETCARSASPDDEGPSRTLPGALPLPYPALVLQVEETHEAPVSELSPEPQLHRASLPASYPDRPRAQAGDSFPLQQSSRVTTLRWQKEPVVVRKGPRLTDPPFSVDGQPVVSAAGPWSYLLRWWDEQRSFRGEVWQVVLEGSTGLSAKVVFRADDGLWYLYAIYD